MAATIKEIAQLAGVSYQAVSATLNGTGKTSPATRERIMGIARELNYRPNKIARSLVSGRSGMIGFVTQDIRAPYFAELSWEMQQAAERRGYRLLMMESNWNDQRTLDCLSQLSTYSVDGIIVIGDVLKRAFEQKLITPDFPLISVDDVDSGNNSVGFDYVTGIREAFAELTAAGINRIGFIHDPVNPAKFAAYRKICQEFNMPEWIEEYVSPTVAGEAAVIQRGREIGRAGNLPKAVLVASDYDALLLIQGLDEIGIRVPGDLKIIAMDDTLLSRVVLPPLPVIRLYRHEQSEIVLRRIDARIRRKEDPDGHLSIPTHFIQRNIVSLQKEDMK